MAVRMMTRKQSVAAAPRLIVSASCLLSSVFCYAEDLPDPTRPPASIFAPAAEAMAGREATENRSSGLHTIIISETRRAAIIDGKTVELGGEHGNAKLVEVNEGGVVLQRAQSRQVLTLFPDVKITRKEMPGEESAKNESSNKESPKSELKVKQPSSANKVQSRKHKTKPTARYEKLSMEPLAVPPGNQTTATKRTVMSGHPHEEK